jgi:hypothetical protein
VCIASSHLGRAHWARIRQLHRSVESFLTVFGGRSVACASPGKWLILSVDARGQVGRAGFLRRPAVPSGSACTARAASRDDDPQRLLGQASGRHGCAAKLAHQLHGRFAATVGVPLAEPGVVIFTPGATVVGDEDGVVVLPKSD